jgi:hypothetical protein
MSRSVPTAIVRTSAHFPPTNGTIASSTLTAYLSWGRLGPKADQACAMTSTTSRKAST